MTLMENLNVMSETWDVCWKMRDQRDRGFGALVGVSSSNPGVGPYGGALLLLDVWGGSAYIGSFGAMCFGGTPGSYAVGVPSGYLHGGIFRYGGRCYGITT